MDVDIHQIKRAWKEEYKMHILYDYQIFSWQKYGGISRYFYELIKRISIVEKVDLYQGYNVNEYGLQRDGNFVELSTHRKKDIPRTGRVYEWINRMGMKIFSQKSNADIYHPTYYNDLNITNKKLVVTAHDMIHELFPKYFLSDKETIKRKRKILSKADRIIAISESTKKDLIEILNLSPKKIDVVYHGNSLRLKVTDERIIQEPYFLYVGTRESYKNFLPMLQAYANTDFKRDLKCVCFGGGNFTETESHEIKKLGLADKVMQLSGDDNMLANLYKYAELFAYPSQYEGFGLPPLEAMYYGTPVICSNNSSLPEVVGDAALMFNPYSVDDMIKAFNHILQDKILRNSLSNKGILRERLFSWDKCANETLGVYKRALEC